MFDKFALQAGSKGERIIMGRANGRAAPKTGSFRTGGTKGEHFVLEFQRVSRPDIDRAGTIGYECDAVEYWLAVITCQLLVIS